MIELNNLYQQYLSIQDEIYAAIALCLHNSHYIGGEEVQKFEESFADYTGAKYCIAVGNGTDALEIIFDALDIHGREVILPAMTAAPTVEAVIRTGNMPVFCDIDHRYTIDLEKVAKMIKKDSVVLPVHLYGVPVDMTTLLSMVGMDSIVEDCAQAHGSLHHGQHVGTFGIAGAFSFYPSKNLGAYGDAGAIITNSEAVAENCRSLRNHGRQGKFDHLVVGRNSRMDSIQAAILSVKLKHLDMWLAARFGNAIKYQRALPEQSPMWELDETNFYSFHQFPLTVENRAEVRQRLKEKGVATGLHYPFILPELPPYQKYARGNYPCAKYLSERELSIPIHEMLSEVDVSKVIETVKEALFEK